MLVKLDLFGYSLKVLSRCGRDERQANSERCESERQDEVPHQFGFLIQLSIIQTALRYSVSGQLAMTGWSDAAPLFPMICIERDA